MCQVLDHSRHTYMAAEASVLCLVLETGLGGVGRSESNLVQLAFRRCSLQCSTGRKRLQEIRRLSNSTCSTGATRDKSVKLLKRLVKQISIASLLVGHYISIQLTRKCYL